MDYLVYVECNAENLQFYLWLRDYTRRFNELPEHERRLSPEWTDEDPPAPTQPSARGQRHASKFAKEINFDLNDSVSSRSPSHGPRSSTGHSFADGSSFITAHTHRATVRTTASIAEDANANVGLKWDAFTIQPFREEITRVIAHYIAPDSPRELNLSHKERAAVLHALQHTTHPSAFDFLNTMVEAILKGQAHPNFVRWSVCNGNKPRVIVLRSLGILGILGALLAMTLLILSRVPRWYRIIPCGLLWIGASTLIASKKGMCMILMFNNQRELKPWEVDVEPASMLGIICKPQTSSVSGNVMELSPKSGSIITQSQVHLRRPEDDERTIGEKGIQHWGLDTFGSDNEWQQEEWVERYTKRPFMRKVFPGSTYVQNKGITQLQVHIIRESQLWALLVTVIVVAGFTAIPKGNFY